MMMTMRLFCFAPLAALVLAAAPAGAELDGRAVLVSETPMGKTVTVTEQQNGNTVKLKVGDTLVVRLPGQLGTGFSWQLATKDGEALAVAGSKVDTKGGGAPGGAEHQAFSFAARSAGTQTLEFRYMRPWERDKPPAKTFAITVKVAAR